MTARQPFLSRLRRWRRHACESVGIARYSRPGLRGLDRLLEGHLDFDDGRFIEAGANDGFKQSNTYYFEKLRGWTGLLIEPVPALAAEARRNRHGPVIEAALVAPEAVGIAELQFAGLMSTLTGALGDSAATRHHVELGLQLQRLPATYTLQVPARTLSSILDEVGWSGEIDLLSLDVEGGEPGALRGVDWERHAPRYLCIEARNRPAVEAALGSRYDVVAVLTDTGTSQDVLYRRR